MRMVTQHVMCHVTQGRESVCNYHDMMPVSFFIGYNLSQALTKHEAQGKSHQRLDVWDESQEVCKAK